MANIYLLDYVNILAFVELKFVFQAAYEMFATFSIVLLSVSPILGRFTPCVLGELNQQ